MRLTYIYHSGFAIEADEFAILIDYYKDTGRSPEKGFVHEKLLNRAGILYVLSSHFHPDHFNPEVLRWKTYKKDIVYLFGKDILKRNRAGKEDAIYLKKGDFYEDHNLRTPEEVAEAEQNYLKELDDLAKATNKLDATMFPVDPRIGTDFMRGAQQFVDHIKTNIFVPMHFWDRPAEVVAFRPYAESRGCRYALISVPGEGTDI